MSLITVDRTQQKEKVAFIMKALKEISVKEACVIKEWQQNANAFLERMDYSKAFLVSQAAEINELLPKLEEVTALSPVDDEISAEVKKLIDVMKQLAFTAVKNYAFYNRIYTSKGIDKTELKAYKQSVADLKELTTDLQDVFLVLPKDEEFQRLNKQLNDL